MEHAQSGHSSRLSVEQLLLDVKHDHYISSRIDLLSRRFLGHPYKANPLIGSADTAEVFTTSVDGFDCVTYIETIVALARASTVDDFAKWLRKIRYEQGIIQWARRNHYMTVWVRNNVREGIIKPISTRGIPILSRERVLNVVPGLPPSRVRLKCVPKTAVPRLVPHFRGGDLIFFVSTRRNLDVFHAGIIVHDGANIFMRHASRSQGFVVQQELSDFLKVNRMTGVIVMRPQQVAEGTPANDLR